MFILPPPFVYTLLLREGDEESRLYVSSTLSHHTVVLLQAFIAVHIFIGRAP